MRLRIHKAEGEYVIRVRRNTVIVDGKTIVTTSVFGFRIIKGTAPKLITTRIYTRECVCGRPNCLGQR